MNGSQDFTLPSLFSVTWMMSPPICSTCSVAVARNEDAARYFAGNMLPV